MDKNILHHIRYDREQPIDNYACNIVRMTGKLITAYVEKVDEYILKTLYEYYKDTDITDLFVIDKQEFKNFILKYLPIYLNEEE